MKTEDINNKQESDGIRVRAAIFILVALVAIGLWYITKNTAKEPVIVPVIAPDTTEFVLVNNTKDCVLVYLTLSGYPATDTVHVKNVHGIFGITDSGLVGSFYLPSKDTVSYKSLKWFSGNVSFGGQPINCFSASWPTGVNPFEFNLNNNQESIDISSIAGINCLLSVDLLGGPKWLASPLYPDVRSFYNDSLYKNTGLVGVYPYGCTNCTDTAGRQPCQVPSETPNKNPICNPTRAAGVHGGKVIVTFKGYTNFEICK